MLLFKVSRSILLIFLIQPLAPANAGNPPKRPRIECILKNRDFPTDPPAIFDLKKDGTIDTQIYPASGNPDIRISEGTKVFISCQDARFKKGSIHKVTAITARCNDKAQMMRISVSANFQRENKELEELQIKDLGCGSKITVCQWKMGVDTPDRKEPIIFKNHNGKTTIVHPVKEGNDRFYRVSRGSDLTVACPPSFINVECDLNGKLKRTVKNGALGNTASIDIDLNIFDCNHGYENTIVDKGSCGIAGSGTKKEIGFRITSYDSAIQHFHPMITVCFESATERTLWTEHTLHGSNIAATKSLEVKDWKHDDLFTSKPTIDQVYTQASQDSHMKATLGKSNLIPSQELFLAKGHISPAGDFTTEAEIRATYHYINAVPQWQAINNGKWKKCIEESTQLLAEARGTNLRIISGGYGILKLDHMTTKAATPIYLGKDKSKKFTKIPVPELTWKLVIEESKDKKVVKAVAFVVINNPFLDKLATAGATRAKPAPLCTNICHQIKWLKNYDSTDNDLKHGYTYCCKVDDLRAQIPYIPNISSVAVDLLDE